jgi:hypothetical protein
MGKVLLGKLPARDYHEGRHFPKPKCGTTAPL